MKTIIVTMLLSMVCGCSSDGPANKKASDLCFSNGGLKQMSKFYLPQENIESVYLYTATCKNNQHFKFRIEQ